MPTLVKYAADFDNNRLKTVILVIYKQEEPDFPTADEEQQCWIFHLEQMDLVQLLQPDIAIFCL